MVSSAAVPTAVTPLARTPPPPAVDVPREEPWRLCVAPMMDWTDRHCRMFHRLLAPHARLYTEMLHANAVVLGDRARLLGFDAAEHPVAVQLGGSEPEVLAEAARVVAEWGYDEVNLNVGCPSDRVQSGRFGACLMREPALVAECVAAMREAVRIPVTVKCRIGVDDQDPRESLFELVDRCTKVGIEVFLVHARKAWLQGLSPRENREVPPLDYRVVHELKRAHPRLHVVLNGGLDSVEAIESAQGLDGVMIGRAAYHQPYLLHGMQAALFGTPIETRAELLRRYLPYVESRLEQGVALKHMTRHVLGLFHGEPGGRHFRQLLSEQAHRPGAGVALIDKAIDLTRPARAAA